MNVDEWLAGTANPKAGVIAAIREILLDDERIDEAIKYRAPAFLHDGRIIAYFHHASKATASLIFPDGGRLDGHRILGDGSNKQRTARFATIDDVVDAHDELLAVIEDWFCVVA
ncbi:MAG: DUF1801 domain-containing protein [Actinomycetota bacterium]